MAAERAGLSPENCIVVEDAPVGLQSGMAAGMKVIGFVGTHSAERLHDAGATCVVEQLNEITPNLVSRLIASAGREAG